MKKKKTIIILSVVAVLIAVSCVGVYAIKNYKSPIANGGMYQTRIGAPKTKTFEIGQLPIQTNTLNTDEQLIDNYKQIINSLQIAQNGTELNYKETIVYNEDNKFDVYVDSNQNEYEYSIDGQFVEFRANAMAVDTVTGTIDKDTITIDDVRALAPKYVKTIFDEDFDEFEMDEAYYDQSKCVYSVTFTKKHGDNNFIKGQHCFVEILPNGSLKSCSFSGQPDYDKFDFNRLNGITENTIDNFVKEQVKTKQDILSYEISGVYLVSKDEDFCLRVYVELEYNTGIRNLEMYYYELK